MDKRSITQFPVELVTLGKIGATYGILGWLKVASYTEDTEDIFNYQPWFIQQACQWQQINLEKWKFHNRNIIIKIEGINTCNAAMKLNYCEILADVSQFPVLAEGNYYWKDLIGCKVITIDGYQMGKVINLMETGSNDVLIVKADLKDAFGIKERLIPFIDKQVIKKVSLVMDTIEVDWNPCF